MYRELTPFDIESLVVAYTLILFAMSRIAVWYVTPLATDLMSEDLYDHLGNIMIPTIFTEWNRLITEVETSRDLLNTLIREAAQLPGGFNRFVNELEVSRAIVTSISQLLYNSNEAIRQFMASINIFIQNPTIGTMVDLIQRAQYIHNTILNILTHVGRLQDISNNSFDQGLEQNYDNIVHHFNSFMDQIVRVGGQATDVAEIPREIMDILKDIGVNLRRY